MNDDTEHVKLSPQQFADLKQQLRTEIKNELIEDAVYEVGKQALSFGTGIFKGFLYLLGICGIAAYVFLQNKGIAVPLPLPTDK